MASSNTDPIVRSSRAANAFTSLNNSSLIVTVVLIYAS